MRGIIMLPLATLCALGACSTSALDRDGVTTFAGDAIAFNSALQIVDPWANGTQDTKLKVPAQRGDGSAAPSGETSGARP